MIVVSGAAGKTGQAVVKALVRRGAAVRAFVYRPEQAEQAKTLGAQQVVFGDMQDAAIFKQVVAGATALYHICPNMNPNELSIGQTAIAAAQAAGLQQFVYHSVLHPHTEKMAHHWHKLRVEEQLFESGLNFTIVQPAAYMQNILAGWTAIVQEGLYQVPYAVETRLGMVDLEDVAEAVATILTEPGHTGAIYELAGPDNLSQTGVANILSDSLGRPVEARQVAIAQWQAEAEAAGLNSFAIETLVKMFQYYNRFGFCGNSNVLGWLLKRPPTSFKTFVDRVKEAA